MDNSYRNEHPTKSFANRRSVAEQFLWLQDKMGPEDHRQIQQTYKDCSSQKFLTKDIPFVLCSLGMVTFGRKYFPKSALGQAKAIPIYIFATFSTLLITQTSTARECAPKMRAVLDDLLVKYGYNEQGGNETSQPGRPSQPPSTYNFTNFVRPDSEEHQRMKGMQTFGSEYSPTLRERSGFNDDEYTRLSRGPVNDQQNLLKGESYLGKQQSQNPSYFNESFGYMSGTPTSQKNDGFQGTDNEERASKGPSTKNRYGDSDFS